MKLVVVTPPPLKPSEPGLSGGAAACTLRSLGADAHWIDASMAWHRFALQPDRLDATLAQLHDRGLDPPDLSALRRSASAMRVRPQPLRRLDTYRHRDVYSSSVNDLENALRIVALPYDGIRLGVAMLAVDRPNRRLESSATLAWLSETPGPFDDYFLEELIPALEARQAGIVAVSLTFQQQAPAAFRLAALLRERMPSALRVLGGPLVSCWNAAGIPLGGPPFPLFHRVVSGSMEDLTQLADLAAEASDRPPSPARTAIGGGPLSVPIAQAPWDDYLSPLPAIPVALGRGCYWRRCTFCPDHLHGPHEPCAPDLLGHWLRGVADAFPGGAMLHLTDSALPIGHLEHIASVIQRDRLPLSWHGFVRAEESLASPDMARHLVAGGCAMLQFGVESGSPEILRRLGKGASPDVARRVLRTCANAGIRTHVYLLFGVPGETDADRAQTLAFVRDEAASIHAINPALLNLPKGSPMHRHASRFGITELAPFGADTDLSLYDDFRCGDVHPRRDARRWLAARFFKDPAVRSIQGRLRAPFKANHLCFMG